MFSTSPFVRSSVRSSITNLWTLYDWTDFNTNWHSWSSWLRHERPTSKVKVLGHRKPKLYLEACRGHYSRPTLISDWNVALEKGAGVLHIVFAARCYASAAYVVIRCLCVCVSVCLSRSYILSKRINISSNKFSSSGSHTILVFPYQTA